MTQFPTCTIGVLTKPDRIPRGEEGQWLRFITGQHEALKNGWYCVKQPDSQDLADRITWKDAREAENNFFMQAPWLTLDSSYQDNLRTANLTDRLSIILSDLIAKRSVLSSSKILYLTVSCIDFPTSIRS